MISVGAVSVDGVDSKSLFSGLVITENSTLAGCTWRPVCSSRNSLSHSPPALMSEDGHTSSYPPIPGNPIRLLAQADASVSGKEEEKTEVLRSNKCSFKKHISLVKIVLQQWSKRISGWGSNYSICKLAWGVCVCQKSISPNEERDKCLTGPPGCC